MKNYPAWMFFNVYISWRLWAFGYYTKDRKNWTFLFIAFGPFRFVFAQLKPLKKRNFQGHSMYRSAKESEDVRKREDSRLESPEACPRPEPRHEADALDHD